MGLSRKLGGGGGGPSPRKAPSPRVVDVPDHVDYTWSTQAYTMREILGRFRLPCVVKCSGDAGAVLWADFRFDMRQPLLLHAARTVRKVHARSLKSMSGGPPGDLTEYGPPLAIPEDYDGWFFPVGRKDPTVLPRHTRVEGAATSPARKFLVTTTLPSFTPCRIPDGSAGTKHVKHEVGIGEVLTKGGVTKGDPALAGGSSSPATALVHRARQSLRCLDENNHEVIIPFSHRALLYDVAENYGTTPASTPSLSKTTTAAAAAAAAAAAKGKGTSSLHPSVPGVVHTRTIISTGNAALPRVFRHVLGELPALAHAFTGILRCYSVFTEETIMAATMSRTNLSSVSKVSSCLELATDSSAKFNIALNESELKKTNQYGLALKTCEELAPCYVRAIKTSFTIQPDVSVLDDVDLSLYDNGKGSEFDQGKEESSVVPKTILANVKGTVQTNPIHFGPSRDIAAPSKLHPNQEDMAIQNSSDENVPINDVREDEISTMIDDFREDESVMTDDIRENESVMTDDPRENESVMTDDNTSVTTDDVRDDEESVMTDDVDDSNMDTVSMSETITSEVEANSEFDISWGQLKRAQSFTGSISTLTDSGTQSPNSINSDSDSDDSVVNHGHFDSFASPQSTLSRDATSTVGTNSTMGTNSSTSEDTVVLRASAPSPVYANVQKKNKFSVFNTNDQSDYVSSSTADPLAESNSGSNTMEERNSEHDNLDSELPHDTTVRSVWNITPTIDDAKNLSYRSHGDVGCDSNTGEENEQPICWGDSSEANPELLLDSEEAILKVHQLSMKSGESGTSTVERHPKSSERPAFWHQLHSQQPSSDSGLATVTHHNATLTSHQSLSSQSSTSSQATVILHPNLSAQSSTGSISSGNSVVIHPQLSAKSSSASTNSSIATVVGHPRLLAKLSTESSSSIQSSNFPPHHLLSSRSSVQSEGTAQDLAILRLEQALSDATTFLKCTGTHATDPAPDSSVSDVDTSGGTSTSIGASSTGPGVSITDVPSAMETSPQSILIGSRKHSSKAKPTPPPRKGNSKSVGFELSDESSSSADRTPQNSSRNSLRKAKAVPVEITSTRGTKDVHTASALSLSEITSIPSLTGNKTAAGYTAHDFSRDRARQRKAAYYQSDTQIYHGGSQPGYHNPAHHASDSQIDSAQSGGEFLSRQAAQEQDEADSESQIDLDFVKALGDRLISVSRKTSLPKYQRLQQNKDHPSDSENSESQDQDGQHQFQKRQQRPGSSANIPVRKGHGDDSMTSDSSQKDAVLDDLDLLHEEVV